MPHRSPANRAIRAGFIRFLAFVLALALDLALASAASRGDAVAIAVGPQYDSTHVYVAPADMDGFVASFTATLGGQASKRIVSTVTPTPSNTQFQYVWTPAGTLSTFAFTTPIPFPFGQERNGYLVRDMPAAIKAARAAGADVIVEPFKDPIGLDAVIEWPGGVTMQLYWHDTAPSYPALATIPENRVYVSRDRADAFLRSFTKFAGARITGELAAADAGEIGRPGETFRRIRLESAFGKMQVMVTDGHLPYPFGREITGYEVQDLDETLRKAAASGAKILTTAHDTDTRRTAMVQFPGGYVAEIHASRPAS